MRLGEDEKRRDCLSSSFDVSRALLRASASKKDPVAIRY